MKRFFLAPIPSETLMAKDPGNLHGLKKDETEFHRVMVSGKLAEIAATYLDKASRVYVEGRLHTHVGTSETVIIGDEIIMLGRRTGAETKSTPKVRSALKAGRLKAK